jgi:CheY-like chemotaxis protein
MRSAAKATHVCRGSVRQGSENRATSDTVLMVEKKVVLVAEDNDDVREALAFLLRQHGYSVVEAGDGDAATRALYEHRPDAVVLDVIMPRGDGRYVRRTMQADTDLSRVPVVILSGVAEPADFPDCTVMRKPVEPDDLIRALARCLEGRRTP